MNLLRTFVVRGRDEVVSDEEEGGRVVWVCDGTSFRFGSDDVEGCLR